MTTTPMPDEELVVIAPTGKHAGAHQTGEGSVEVVEENDSFGELPDDFAEHEIEELGLDSKMGRTQRLVIWLVVALIVIGAVYVCWYWFFR